MWKGLGDMGNAPRCPRCGSSNTRKSDNRLLKGGLAHIGEFALGYGLGWLGLEDYAKDNANDLTLTQYLDDEFQCKDCGCVWKPGQRPVVNQNQQHRKPSQPQKKKNKPQSTNQQLIGGTSIVPYSRRELVGIIAQCEGLNPGSCNESSLLTTDKNVIIQQLQNKFGIRLSKSRINNVNTYKGLINKILEVGSLYQTVETVAPAYQENEDDFWTDWDLFFDNIDSYLSNRQSLEDEYNNSCRKARKQVNRNPNASACYYYMASVLCYFFYDDSEKPKNDREYALELGKSAINSAKQMLQDDGEFKTLSLVYEMLDLTQKEHDVYNGFQKIQTIKNTCPRIETLSNTLIKTEALKEWFDKAYYDFLSTKLFEEEEVFERDIKLKAMYASELTNSSDDFLRLFAYAFLADALYDEGNFIDAKRYAKFGMDILDVLTDYNHNDIINRFWGMCFTIYARSQEKVGELKDAIELYTRGAALGIPWCNQDLERLKPESNEKNTTAPSSSNRNTDSGYTKSEQEYINTLNECFEDGEISPRERKMLDRIRISLGISEERAKEIETSLSSPKLTEDEQEYWDAYKEATIDGEISEKESRLLEKLRVLYNISENRAREIESM